MTVARRPPVVATLIVVAAVATMIALGLWQLDRRGEKAALLARLDANRTRPVIDLPADPADDLRFRRVRLTCAGMTSWRLEAGRSVDDVAGYRHLAMCMRRGALPVMVDVGVGHDPHAAPRWAGGTVTGVLTRGRGDASWLDRWTGRMGAALPLVVADRPAPGLSASRPPDVDSVPDNHLAYALQWFFFAAAAAAVYVLALRRRSR